MNIKVNDQVYCKRSFKLNDMTFTKGLRYPVTIVNSVHFQVMSNNLEDCAFSLNEDSDLFKFSDHFFTDKEYNTLKKFVSLYSN